MYQNDTQVLTLDCAKAFESLTQREKLYAHHLSQASWIGGLIMLFQTSRESPLIFVMLMKLFGSQTMDTLKTLALDHCGINESEFQGLLVYTSALLTNLGNYDKFRLKFVPRIPPDKLKSLIEKSDAFEADAKLMDFLWAECANQMFLVNNQVGQVKGYMDQGLSAYFSSDYTEQDAVVTLQFLVSKNIRASYALAFKTCNKSYKIRIASQLSDEDEDQHLTSTYHHEGNTFNVTFGVYGPLLGLVNSSLEEAKRYAANENEVKMLDYYIESFKTGSSIAHKQGTIFWIKNQCPIIETYIGFGVYMRPSGDAIGDFEGFVAVVNKEMAAKFRKLVKSAESLLQLLPWPKTFEEDKFLKPDFNTLDILTFSAANRKTIGMHISDYDEISQRISKNFYLGNVISYGTQEASTEFLSVADQELVNKYAAAFSELHVGLHELLGHGSGKLFRRNAEGEFNFDIKTVINPITRGKIKSWYNEGETFYTKFLSLAPSYEECRCECVALLLSIDKKVLKIFGYEGIEAEDVTYAFWLNVLQAGLRGVNAYDTSTKLWTHIHFQAWFVILRVLLAARKFLAVRTIRDSSGCPDLLISLDRKKIVNVGKRTISSFLQKLQVYKSTGDIKSATALYNKYSAIPNYDEPCFKCIRNITAARLQSRMSFWVMSNTCVTDNGVVLKSYEASHEGIIQSWIERQPSSLDLMSILKSLWEKEYRQ